MRALLGVLALLAPALPAEADEASDPPRPPRPWHGSIGGGGALLLTGLDGGKRLRLEGEIDVLFPESRHGVLLAMRAADRDHLGLLTGGVMFEAGASRPRIVLGLHADLGVDLDRLAPVAGGGIRTTIKIYKALGIALDNGAYLVVAGLRDTRLVFSSSTSLVLRW